MSKRQLRLPAAGSETFFLWGPRQSGKTTLLRQTYPDAFWIDLLKADEFRRYLQNPELLRGELQAQKAVRRVVIDEVQKVPQLLDEAHWIPRTSPYSARTLWLERAQGQAWTSQSTRGPRGSV